MAKRCPDCGTELKDSATECPECHLILDVESRPSNEAPATEAKTGNEPDRNEKEQPAPSGAAPTPPAGFGITRANIEVTSEGSDAPPRSAALDPTWVFVQIVIAAIIAVVVVNERRLKGSEGFWEALFVFLVVMLVVSVIGLVGSSLLQRRK